MKTIITSILLITTLSVTSQTLTLVPESSTIEWIGYGEAGGFMQQGSIDPQQGEITMSSDSISEGFLVIDMTSIHHNDENLEKHLLKKDFFWSSKYPSAQLVVESIENGKATGLLTIRGITEYIDFPVDIEMKGGKVVIKGSLTIDRTKFGIKYNSNSYFQDLGSYAIKNDFDLNFELLFD